jgi:hypothetical protein
VEIVIIGADRVLGALAVLRWAFAGALSALVYRAGQARTPNT